MLFPVLSFLRFFIGNLSYLDDKESIAGMEEYFTVLLNDPEYYAPEFYDFFHQCSLLSAFPQIFNLVSMHWKGQSSISLYQYLSYQISAQYNKKYGLECDSKKRIVIKFEFVLTMEIMGSIKGKEAWKISKTPEEFGELHTHVETRFESRRLKYPMPNFPFEITRTSTFIDTEQDGLSESKMNTKGAELEDYLAKLFNIDSLFNSFVVRRFFQFKESDLFEQEQKAILDLNDYLDFESSGTEEEAKFFRDREGSIYNSRYFNSGTENMMQESTPMTYSLLKSANQPFLD